MYGWTKYLADEGIRRCTEQDPALAQVLARALPGIEALLRDTGLPYRLAAHLTRDGEYLIRMQVAYRSKWERDRLWDRAASILERARRGRAVDILCGIAGLPQAN